MSLESIGLPAFPLAVNTAVEHRDDVVPPRGKWNTAVGCKRRSYGQLHVVPGRGRIVKGVYGSEQS